MEELVEEIYNILEAINEEQIENYESELFDNFTSYRENLYELMVESLSKLRFNESGEKIVSSFDNKRCGWFEKDGGGENCSLAILMNDDKVDLESLKERFDSQDDEDSIYGASIDDQLRQNHDEMYYHLTLTWFDNYKMNLEEFFKDRRRLFKVAKFLQS